MTPNNEALPQETLLTLDEVICHSRGRTGKVADAIEAGFTALRDHVPLAAGHRAELAEFASLVSPYTPCADGAGIGARYAQWRDAVLTLLGTLLPDPLQELATSFATSLTPQQAVQLTSSLSPQQRDILQQILQTKSAVTSM